MANGGWRRVVMAVECTDLYGDGEVLLCPLCGIDYAECPCPGPHQDDLYVYEERDGVLWARLVEGLQLDLFQDSPQGRRTDEAAITKQGGQVAGGAQAAGPRLPGDVLALEPNGRLSRRKDAVEGRVMDVVVNRRIRQLRLTGDGDTPPDRQALDPRRGYVLGLMFLEGSIDATQHEAGLLYGEDMARFYALTGLPFPSPRAQNMFVVRGESGGETMAHVMAAKLARRRMAELRRALLATGDFETGCRVEQAVRAVCLLDQAESRFWPAPMTGWLRRGLTVLAGHYGLVRLTPNAAAN